MTVLARKRGTWLNQFAKPTHQMFVTRARQVDYTVIKFGMKVYEETAAQFGIPWVAERMGEEGAGTQNGPANALKYAEQLAAQANQPGCIAAVINLEEADGGWHTDDGWATLRLVSRFRQLCSKPLFASIDTRGNRPNYPYQRALAATCDGVMPMVYPTAFGQSAAVAFRSAVTDLMRARWAGKEIIPTYQTYDAADVPSQIAQVNSLYSSGIAVGANSYTLGHATQAQWDASLAFIPAPVAPPAPPPNVDGGLVALRKLWVDGWHAIEQRGTIGEAAAFVDFWKRLVGTDPINAPK